MRAPRTFDEIRLVEWGPLGHGPTWLRLMMRAFSGIAERVAIHHPPDPSYDVLETYRRTLPDGGAGRVRLVPFESSRPRRDVLRAEALALATAPGADVALITFVDRVVELPAAHAGSSAVPPGQRPLVWGVWLGPRDHRVLRRPLLHRLVSARARRDHDTWRAQSRPPPWLDAALFVDGDLAGRVDLGDRAFVLPDPWWSKPREDRRESRRRLGLPEDRVLFLHAGAAEARKGLADTVDVFERSSDERAFLVRVGPRAPAESARLRALAARGRAFVDERFVPDDEFDAHLRACDWVLLPYRSHDSSSAILSRAAGAQRPAIAADFGAFGRRVRERGLGLVFEHGSGAALAAAVEAALRERPERFVPRLDAYADEHSPDAYVEALRRAVASVRAPRAPRR